MKERGGAVAIFKKKLLDRMFLQTKIEQTSNLMNQKTFKYKLKKKQTINEKNEEMNKNANGTAIY